MATASVGMSSPSNLFGSQSDASRNPQHNTVSSPNSGSGNLFNVGNLLGALKVNQNRLPTDKKLEYLFEDEYVPNGPSWGARICYGAGTTYLTGLATGGLWGLFDGLRNPQGRSSLRLRINCILNSSTGRGPFVANSLGMLALLYNLIHGGVIKLRNDKYDLASSVASAVAAGVIFKSTAGLKKAGLGGLAMGGFMLAYQLAREYQRSGSLSSVKIQS